MEKAKRGRGRPSKEIVPHALPADFDRKEHGSYIELYYGADRQPLPLETITDRIKEADRNINRNIAQTALDIYFVKRNWKTTYSRDKKLQFKSWLAETVPFSRSYALDLLKCVKELIEYKSGEGSEEFDDALLATVQTVFNSYGIGVLRDVIHAPVKIKGQYVQQLLDGENIDIEEIKASKAAAAPKRGDTQYIKAHRLSINGKPVLSLANLTKEDSELAAKIEKAIERVCRQHFGAT